MNIFESIDKLRTTAYQKIRRTLEVTGGVALLTVQTIRDMFTPPFYFGLTLEQIVNIGVNSLPLIFVTGLATGAVMALQFGYGLEKFGGKFYIPKVTSLSLMREMGPVFTSLMIAGRIGSGMAAEIGSMCVTQQIDAIRALGTNPIKRIVVPRMLAMLIVLPLLTMVSIYVGLFGAMGVASEMGIGSQFFWEKIFETVIFSDLWTGLAKTFFFGYFIVIFASYRGLNTGGGTRGVGDSTTWVVVASSIAIMVSDFFLTKLFVGLTK
jgi:phospholipid/cholesterol/gamma-HCH transport system permease protein